MRQVKAVDIKLDDEQTVMVPHSSTLLAVKMTGATPSLFYATPVQDTGEPDAPVTLIMRQTEDSREALPEFDLCYLGSIQEFPGRPWTHVFSQFSNAVYSTGVLL